MSMTLSQLRAFALVARLGSLRAAAEALQISEPAVSSALAALRADLGDPLFVRCRGGIALTRGGRALADHAQEIVGLADQARQAVANARTSTGGLRAVATAAFAEHAAGRLLDLFTKRFPLFTVDVVVEGVADVAALLASHTYDIALGARPAPMGPAMQLVPFLRYRRVLVAAGAHPLARWSKAPLQLSRLKPYKWFAGPVGVEGADAAGRWSAGTGPMPEVVQLSSETDALAAVRAGEGVMLALEHIVRSETVAGSLVQLPLVGTPIAGIWWASTLDHGRTVTGAQTLQRFVTTAEATAAMMAPAGSRGLARRGSKVHVALWS
ncbi:LysR family transcriptional regulator [Crystallibacter degradans]|uniref:LysR family transcriptional regulator n=1 Tax=Crystallibacter degradans TaxID=2726743 RepID=UPI0014738E4B|nr:LysR family transcriptional regulator [Arthrobacter sp. SF27]NMR28352.1 LysR family transcriptional regulator [Arthrobacter sp. SF27]